MKKNLGVTRFEFFFVMVAIGLIVSVGMQRYSQLAEETKRLNFEVIANNFNAAVYNHHARWIVAQQQSTKLSRINIDGVEFQFSAQGWPLSIFADTAPAIPTQIQNCLSLWNNLLQNPPPISYNNENLSQSFTYHLSITPEGNCRYKLLTPQLPEYYFDYAPSIGKVTIFTAPITKNS